MKTTPSKVFGRSLPAIFTFVLSLLFAASLPGQFGPTGAFRIGSITVRFVGVANVSEQVVRANMQVREGAELDETVIDRDIRSLYRTGLFEFIEVKREVLPDRTVNLVVEVTPKYRVLDVRFEGNTTVSDRRLLREVTTTPNTALDERTIKQDAEAVFKYYQKRGHSQAEVTYNIDRDRTTGFGTVIYRIREGPRVKISRIEFAGNHSFGDRRLRKALDTKRWWMLSWLTGSGRFKDDVFEDDLDKLRDFYRDEGFLDVEIPQDLVTFDYPRSGRLVLTVNINEGAQYRLGDITISGNSLYPTETLRAALRRRSGDVFSPSKLDEDAERLEEFYGRDGYLDTRVGLLRIPNIETGDIDVEYRISESDKFFVESVSIEGNTKTKSVVILRELNLGPGDVFDMTRMRVSRMKLENTRFFDDVTLTPESTNLPGRRNLKVAVREARTGNLTFGAGFSSLERAVLFGEVTQGNFDLFNRRSWFQGDGQKFRLRAQIGSYSSEVILAFEEPWLFEQELALGFQVFRTSSAFVSAFYDELRTGGEVYLRRRLFQLLEGRLSYRYENVNLDIRDFTLSEEIRQLIEGASGAVSKVGFQLLFDTRDSLLTTTQGNRIEFNSELAGGPFRGKYDYYRFDTRAAQYFPIFLTQNQVLSVTARAGLVQNYGRSDEVPFFDRFFLGGPQDLRGFEFRDVGPKDSQGEPIGGKSYGMFSVEYSVDIVSPIRFAIFYDAGFVNAKAFDFNPSRYNDNFGFGIRLFMAGAPIRFDFGIPLTADPLNKRGGQFHFSLANPF